MSVTFEIAHPYPAVSMHAMLYPLNIHVDKSIGIQSMRGLCRIYLSKTEGNLDYFGMFGGRD